jgi:hypothetical protein
MPGEELFYLTISELAKRIESKRLSPVELTQAYLDRSQKLGPRFNAYARLTPEIALARPLSRPPSWHPLRRQRFAFGKRPSDHLGREALRQPGFQLRRHRHRASQPRGCCDDREGRDDRACRWNGIPICFGIIARRSQESLGRDVLDVRIIVRIGRDRRRGARGFCDRHRDLGLDHLPVGVLRGQRIAADLRARQPLWRDGTLSFDGQDRTPRAISR